ncbi:hypothetical protein VKT23_014720 [Stygiomarasmius scandens]|uniref:Uncharacterized protein n=1 Tax=Marasmiellus scandens TaxID=2682957 RepID=A0ABR1J493_9AGAR
MNGWMETENSTGYGYAQTQDTENDKDDSDADEKDKVQEALAGLTDTDIDPVIDDDDDKTPLSRTVSPKWKRKTSIVSVQDGLLHGLPRKIRLCTSGSDIPAPVLASASILVVRTDLNQQ